MLHRSLLPVYILLTVILLVILQGLPQAPTRYQRLFPYGYFKKPTAHDTPSSIFRSPHAPEFTNGQNVLRPGDILNEAPHKSSLDQPEQLPNEPSNNIAALSDVRDEQFYKGGLLTLSIDQPSPPLPVVYDPYPTYNSDEWQKAWAGKWRACEGPDGIDLDRSNPHDMTTVYPGNQKDFPSPKLGSVDAIGLDGQVCADRYSRYGIYGYSALEQSVNPIDWNKVNWGRLQSRCFLRNAGRYQVRQGDSDHVIPLPSEFTPPREEKKDTSSGYKPRSAVIIPVWHNLFWTESIKHYVRSVIAELALHSGAEYEIFILANVKNGTDLYSHDGTVNDTNVDRLRDSYIPPEFRDMVVFFNERSLEEWYPKSEENSTDSQNRQAVQIFAQTNPNFDFYWQLEVDARFTGNTYHFLDKATEFARSQPRKYLWERNAYFYVQDAHGSWDEFRKMVEHSMVGKEHESVWGPFLKAGVSPIGPKPPVQRPSDDDYQWGVHEEADFITFLPIFDPVQTEWVNAREMWNLPPESTAGDPMKEIPRRASVSTMSRLSKTLLNTMHNAELQGWGLAPEMSAATFALWHGLKAVHVPHPIYVDGKWTPKELARVLNPGSPERINGGPDSVWNWNNGLDRVLHRLSYMSTTQTAEDLFRRWMGDKIESKNSEEHYHKTPNERNSSENAESREDRYGRLCYPSFFMHTIKNPKRQKVPA